MSLVERLTAALGDELADPEEGDRGSPARAETFLLYSQPMASHNLGFVDPKASSIDVGVGGREYTVHQSPAVLASSRAGGTTGAGACRPRSRRRNGGPRLTALRA
ncbi:Hypothetical protein TPAR_09638 [Tolypocladium paradoxum]|uniref:Uncharacterized protein n=1 Tax=Tolypocladium paradoxum TaxID=94208 RepID=A0A2S4KLW1_9HYPO|nr:Hypothetical protein TPAR_09638 [Tolypocladium paradoxum]